jgi:hypothetical protein
MKDLYADIECPNCGLRTGIKVEEMVPGRSKDCTHCGAKFEFSGDDGRRAQRALDDLEAEVKGLSREFTIRL